VSDGHFNRSILPKTDYQSGLRAGRAGMKQISIAAFLHTLETTCPEFSEERKEETLNVFKTLLERDGWT